MKVKGTGRKIKGTRTTLERSRAFRRARTAANEKYRTSTVTVTFMMVPQFVEKWEDRSNGWSGKMVSKHSGNRKQVYFPDLELLVYFQDGKLVITKIGNEVFDQQKKALDLLESNQSFFKEVIPENSSLEFPLPVLDKLHAIYLWECRLAKEKEHITQDSCFNLIK